MNWRSGRCLCGAVCYEFGALPDHLAYCHGGMYARFCGLIGLDTLVGAIVRQGQEVIRSYASSGRAERGFFGSSLLWRMTAPGPAQGMLKLNAGMLGDRNRLPPRLEIDIERKPEDDAFAGETTKMTEAEVEALFAPSDTGDSQ